MKYYIPTSSLNLDNILQAECISPFPFYAERKTGYKNFEIIQQLKGINKIVLFRYPVRFTIDDPNRYNYPLLIEVEDPKQLCGDSLRSESNGIFTYSKTLYLTPTNCRLFFFSESAYKLTTINTKSNKSIKYYDSYQILPTTAGLSLKEMPTINIDEKELLADNAETQNDKYKGLLYAYLLGQKLSLSPELAHQKKLTQDIYDMISGIMANPSMSEVFKTKLNNLMDEYKSVDAIEKENKQKLYSYYKPILERYEFLERLPKLIGMAKEIGIWELNYRELLKIIGCKTLPLMSELISREDYRRLGEIVERRTEQSIVNFRKTMPHPSLSAVHNNNQIIIEGLPVLTIAINYVINNKLTPEQLSAHRADHCLGVINEIKEYYIREFGEDSWNKDVRAYVNNLYSHIQNISVPFNLHSIENAELLAIAAFLLRGHNIDNYLTYLKMNEISDYGLPLILWGTLCGYIEMNKEVLLEVLTMDCYKEVYRHLFSFNMYESVWEKVVDDNTTEQSFPENIEEQNLFLKSISKDCKVSVKNDKKIYIKLYKLYGISPELLEAIEQSPLLKRGKKTVIKNLKKMLTPQKTKRKANKKEEVLPFPEEEKTVSLHITGYDEALAYIETNTSEQIQKKLRNNLEYIDKEYTGKRRFSDTRDNPVQHFSHLCFSMSNKWNRLEETPENRKHVEQLCTILNGNC